MLFHIDNNIVCMQTRIELDHYPDFKDDTTFVTELIAEQGVTCMPGSVRGHQHFCAICICNDDVMFMLTDFWLRFFVPYCPDDP